MRSILIFTTFFLFVNGLLAQVPVDYYNSASGLTGTDLKLELHDIITTGHSPISYSGLWSAYSTTDRDLYYENDNTIMDMYTEIPGGVDTYDFTYSTDQCGTYIGEGGCYNREHSFPKSWWGGVESGDKYTDLNHVIPTDGYVNSKRSSYPYGVVSSPTYTSSNGSKLGPNDVSGSGYTGTVFEPIDAFKGDLARMLFYMATRYKDEIPGWVSSYGGTTDIDVVFQSSGEFQSWYYDMLLSWHEADPVSQKELDRNDAVYNEQGNANPFIDHPEYVCEIWGGCAVDPEPTNQATGFSASTNGSAQIDLSWTDAATGTQAPDGYLIKASTTNSFTDPVDGTDPSTDTDMSDGSGLVKVSHGTQSYSFTGLSAETTYYFKMWSYTNSGANVDFKIDGTVPTGNATTDVAPAIGIIAIQDYDGTTPSWSYSGDGSVGASYGKTGNGYRIGGSDIITLNSVDVSGYSSIKLYISDASTGGIENADALEIYVNVDGAGFSGTPDVTIQESDPSDGTYNVSWDYSASNTATTTAGTPITVYGDGATGYANVEISIPDGSSTVELKIASNNNNTTEYYYIDDIKIEGESAASAPSLTVSTSSLTGFTYEIGQGPSAEQSFTVEGSDLTDDITLTPPTNYEISTGTGGSFVAENPITLTQSGGAVSSTTIYVRLKSGLSEGDYNSEDITVASTGATSETVTCSGYVSNRPDWCNLQSPVSGSMYTGGVFNVYARVYEDGVTNAAGQGAGISGWIGYSTTDSDPSTWTNWVAATYNVDAGNNDEYVANIGSALSAGTYYYASRFTVDGTNYSYGGYSAGGGGFWDNATFVSGTLTVTVNYPDWCNLQWPESGSIDLGDAYAVYAQVCEQGVTDAAGQGAGVTAWIGYSTADTDPSTWTDWVIASYNTDDGNNDEYVADIGAALSAGGTYYYASRFSVNGTDYKYGGFNSGFWDGSTNVSGVLTVTAPSVNIVINEIAANPGGSYNNEYVELYNAGASAVDLNGYKLIIKRSGTTDVNVTIGSTGSNIGGTTIALGGYFVITRGTVTHSPRIEYSDLFLNKSSHVILQDASSTQIDIAGSSYDFSSGTNYELCDPTADNSDMSYWIDQGTSYAGTPGSANTATCPVFYDTDSDVSASGTLTEPATIASVIDTEVEKVDVFDFTFTDAGTSDGEVTLIDELIVSQGSANDVADWTNAIAGAYLSGNDLGSDLAGTVAATTITFTSDDMISIADGGNETYTLKIYLNTDLSAISDNDVLEFALDYTNIVTDAAGSSFGSGAPESGDANVAIDIDVAEIQFGQQPANTMRTQSMNPVVTVKACDANGNIDVDFNADITLTSDGTMTDDPITISLTNGIAEFDVVHEIVESGLRLTASESTGTYSDVTSNSFDITVLRCTDLMISEYMEGTSERSGIELFNGTGSSIDLSNFELSKDTDGNNTWDETMALSGTLPNGEVYLIVYKNNDGSPTTDLTDDGISYDLASNSSVMQFSGNDPIGLFKNVAKGFVLLDIVPGPGDSYVDKNLTRNSDVFSPSATFDASQWGVVDPANAGTLGTTENPLPVTWADVSARSLNGSVLVEWSTHLEINNDYFEIEHSLNNADFRQVGIIDGAGNSSVIQNYSYLHSGAVLGNNYYRIKQVDFDGHSDYSKVVTAKLDSETDSKLSIEYLFVNDQKHEMAVQYKKHAKLVIEIFDITGKLVLTQSEIMTEDYQRINLENFNAKEGMFIISVKTDNQIVSEKFMVK